MIWIFVLITGIGRHYKAPSASMAPAINVGDHFYVSKINYMFSKTKVPNRGDVVVFKNSKNALVMVKRVVGLPNDTVKMTDGRLVVNGKIVSRKHNSNFRYRDNRGSVIAVEQYREYLPDSENKHIIFEQIHNGRFDNTEEFIVPEDHIFVMGDNRDNSMDSRAEHGPGFVPVENIIGEATYIMFSSGKCSAEDGLRCPPFRAMKKL